MKKWVSVILTLMLALSATTALANVNPPEGSTRIAPEGETIELSIFQPLTTLVTDLSAENNQATKIIEDATGLKLNFITAPASDAKTKLNLLMSSGDYPEVISYRAGGIDRIGMDSYAQQGILVALDDYLTAEIAPNITSIFESNAAAKTVCTASDGKVYAAPDINECFHCLYGDGRAWYYMPWMQDINKGVLPTTTAELETYLQYIKDNDVNGNGDPDDEIPLAFNATDNAGINRFAIWISNFFMVYPSKHYVVADDGTVKACFTQPEYKQALEYAHELYEKGLILQDAFSIKVDDLRTIGEDPAGARLGLIIGWGPEDGVTKAGETKRWFQYFPLSPVEGPTGQRNHVYTGQWGSVAPGYFVTDKCKNVEAAVKLADLLEDYYFTYTTYFGPKGVTWDDPDEGAVGFNGQPAQFKELMSYGTQPQNCSWDQASISNRPASFRLSQEAQGADQIYKYLDGDYSLLDTVSQLGSYNEIMKYYGCQKNLDPYKFDEKYVVPSLLYSADVSDIVADANAAVDAYRLEMIAAFVTGTRSLDEYDAYVSELEGMGLNDILKAMNDAYQKTLAK